MSAAFELIHGLFVHVGRAIDRPTFDFRRKRNGAGDLGAAALGGLDDFENRAVEQHVIEGFEAYAYFGSGHGDYFFWLSRTAASTWAGTCSKCDGSIE